MSFKTSQLTSSYTSIYKDQRTNPNAGVATGKTGPSFTPPHRTSVCLSSVTSKFQEHSALCLLVFFLSKINELTLTLTLSTNSACTLCVQRRLCTPSIQIVYILDPGRVHPRPRLCAPSTQIVYTLDPDSRLSKAKTAR